MKRVLSHRWVLFSTLILLLISGGAAAHPFSLSYLQAQVEGDHVNVFLDLDTMTVEALLPLDQNDDSWLDTDEVEAGQELLLEYLDTKLALSGNDGESETWKTCLPRAISNLKVIEAGRIEFDRVYDCSVGIEALRIRNATFMEDRGGHTFVADVTLGEKSEHLSFFRDQPAYQLGPGTDPFAQELDQPKSGSPEEDLSSGGEPSVEPSSVGAVSLEYLWQGLLHIWTGIDHILFVLSLLLVIRRWKDVGLLVTSFTVAHSITLILGTLEIVPVEQWLGTVVVECAIALSIGYVAIENLWEVRGGITKTPSGSRRRLGLTFLFGLMHGFGFSSLLREFGLPSDALAPALLAFNVGVELGQLAIVLPVFPLLLLLARRPRLLLPVVRVGSGLVGLLAFFWFVERAFGLAFMPF